MRLDVRGRNFDPDPAKPADSQKAALDAEPSEARDVPFTDTNPPGVTLGAASHPSKLPIVPRAIESPDRPADSSSAHPQPSDEQLLAAYRSGDRASFDALVKRYDRELFHFLVRFMGNRAAADDAFQETFLQVYQSADTFDPTRHFRPWLFTIAANKARDLLRSQSRRNATPLQANVNPNDEDGSQFVDLLKSTAELPSQPLEQSEMRDLVHRTIDGMPEHLREIVLLSYFHQFPYKTISDILGIPLGTVKSRLHAAVAFFAHRWSALHLPPPTL
jgi:RNA polymerase sigma-70 factor (ECF subfamily)